MESDHAVERLKSARSGDRGAFEAMIEASRGALEDHIRRRLGNHLRPIVDQQDLFQETMAQALKSIRDCRADDEKSFLRWLKGIAENLILNLARRRRSDRILYVPQDAPAAEPTPSQGLRRDERWTRLEEALNTLSPEQRRAVQLVRIDGLKVKDAAAEMNLTARAVSRLLGRALKNLQDVFGETGSFSLPNGRRFVSRGESDGC